MLAGYSLAPAAEGTAEAMAFDGVVGADWQTFRLPDEISTSGEMLSAAVAAGGVWVLARADDLNDLVVAWTRDGEAWEVIPLSDAGVPAGIPGAGVIVANQDRVAIVLDNADSANRTNVFPDGSEVQPVPWVLTFDEGEWRTWTPEASGTWDETGADAELHYVGVAGAGFAGDDLVSAVSVRWFGGRGSALVDLSVATSVHVPNQQVSLHSPNRAPLAGPDLQEVRSVVSAGESVHLVGSSYRRAGGGEQAVVWTSEDGVAWEESVIDTVSSPHGTRAQTAVAFEQQLIVAVTLDVNRSSRSFVLAARDQSGSWESVPLPAPDASYALATDGFRVYAVDEEYLPSSTLLSSTDLQTWEVVADDVPYHGSASTRMLGYPGGIAMLDSIFLYISGPFPAGAP